MRNVFGRMAALLVALAAAGHAFAQAQPQGQPAANAETYKDWVVGCDPPKDGVRQCGMVQNLTVKETGQMVARLTVQQERNGERVGILLGPLGTSLAAGVTTQVDAGPQNRLQFEQCVPAGCVARWLLDPRTLDALKRGRTLTVGFASVDGRKVNIPMSLLGFGEGLAALDARR